MRHLLRLHLRRGVWDIYTENYTVAKRNERAKLAKRYSQFIEDPILVWCQFSPQWGLFAESKELIFTCQDPGAAKTTWKRRNKDGGLTDLISRFHTTTETETLLPWCNDRQMSLQNRQSQTWLPAAQVIGSWWSCQGCLARERMISQQRMLEQLEIPVKTGNWKRSHPFPHTVYKMKASEQIRAGEDCRRLRRPNSWRQTGSELGPRTSKCGD